VEGWWGWAFPTGKQRNTSDALGLNVENRTANHPPPYGKKNGDVRDTLGTVESKSYEITKIAIADKIGGSSGGKGDPKALTQAS